LGSNSGAITFTIENIGNQNLTLSGTPKIAMAGSGDFTVDQSVVTTPVAALGNTAFTVTFTPSSIGAKTATLTIANNDFDEGSYTITLNGSCTSVYSSVPAPGTINVGSAILGSSVTKPLTVSNTGGSQLDVSLSIGGTNASDFSITPSSAFSIVNGGSPKSLTIQCTPSAAGTRTGTLTVTHNASGSPAIYSLQWVVLNR
jgi:hypothetical protein